MSATRRHFLGMAGAVALASAAAGTAVSQTRTGGSPVVKPPRLKPGDTVGLIDPASATFESVKIEIAVNDDFRHRVVLISIPRHRIVWQYGHTDVKGSANGYLDTPDGMDLLPYRKALAIPALRRRGA